MCYRKTVNGESFRKALAETKTLEPYQRKIIEDRYIYILTSFENRAILYAFFFHISRFIITVGSLIVPALLSIQYIDTGKSNEMSSDNFSFQIYWTTWVVSLLVTTSNGIFTLFKIDKKYYLLHTMLEQLRSEGWQYLQLSGRFSGFYTPREKPTHANQFLIFCHTVEKLKMKQVEEEYYKTMETSSHSSISTHSTTGKTEHTDVESGGGGAGAAVQKNTHIPAFYTDSLIPPTPLNPQLQQLLQALSIEGVNGTKHSSTQSASEVILQSPPEMSVRSELQGKSDGKESILRQTSEVLSKTESSDRIGTDLQTESLEQKSKTETNA